MLRNEKKSELVRSILGHSNSESDSRAMHSSWVLKGGTVAEHCASKRGLGI